MAVTINIPSQVKTYANLAAFPASGSLKTIYIAEDTNKTYRWTGSVYVEISASAAMTWGQIGGTLSNQTDLQNALDAKVPTTRTLTINGTTQDLSANRTFNIPTDLTVGTTPISSGTIGRVLFQGTGNVLQQSSSLFWDSTNNRLGIGTSSPAYSFQVKSAAGNPIAFFSQNDLVNQGGIAIYQTQISSTAGNPLYLTSTNALYLESNGVERMRIFTNGNVAINTTTDAGFRLDVNGTARINTLTIGLGGGQIASNTAIGVTALNANTTATQGVAIGFESLLFNTTGVQNTAVGALSLRANTTGQLNSAFGRSSLSSNTTSNQNTGFGAYTLLSNSTGANNTAMGVFALSNTTAGNNTAIGIAAGTNNTSGANNIFIGANATGVSNTESNRTWIGNSSTTSTWLAGNVLINTTTDAGFRLDVNGTARSTDFRLADNTLIAAAYTTGGTSLTISTAAHFNATGISVTSAVGIRAYSNIGVGVNNILGASIYAAGGSSFGYISLGLLSNRALITSTANGLAMHTSSMLQVDSTTQGFLPPRMTTTQKNAIASPATGLQVYDTTLNRPCFYDGTTWITL